MAMKYRGSSEKTKTPVVVKGASRTKSRMLTIKPQYFPQIFEHSATETMIYHIAEDGTITSIEPVATSFSNAAIKEADIKVNERTVNDVNLVSFLLSEIHQELRALNDGLEKRNW